jgi:hypothetical protein
VKFKINEVELDAPENLTVRELVEAEQALGFSMDSGSGAQMAVLLFVAMRKADPNKPAALLADDVLNSDISTVEEVEGEDPPAETPAETAGDLEEQRTSGALRSVNTA